MKRLLSTGIFLVIVLLGLTACADKEKIFTYEIEYELNGGTAEYLPQSAESSADFILPEPQKSGFTFAGWYDNPVFAGEPVAFIPKGNAASIHLYAKFLRRLEIIYITDGGTHDNPAYFTEEENLILNPAQKSGYIFCGWYRTPDFKNGKTELIASERENVTLYAFFSEAFVITYDLQGGRNNAENPDLYCAEDSVVLADPEKDGHKFVGWYDLSGGRVVKIPKGSHENLVLRAEWERGEYSVAWDMKGGSSAHSYPTGYAYGEGVSEAQFVYPSKQDMVFGGWYEDINGTPKYVKSISASEYGDRSFYAMWTPAVAVSSGESWVWSGSTGLKSANVAADDKALTVSVPTELMNVYNEGKLGLEIVGGFYADVRSQGDAVGTARAYMRVNSREYEVSAVSKQGGGYSYWNGFWTVPLNGDWGYSGVRYVTARLTLTSEKTYVGYKYSMSSNKENADVTTSLKYGCASLVCRFYIV